MVRRLALITTAIVLGAIGLALLYWGAQLAVAGGSAYYLVAGLFLSAAAIFIMMGSRVGYWLVFAITLATVPWAIWEVGLDRWGLIARLLAPTVLLLALTILAPVLRPARFEPRQVPRKPFLLFAAVQIMALAGAWFAIRDVAPDVTDARAVVAKAGPTGWAHYGGDWRGDRFSRLSQITPANAAALEPAWTYRAGGLDQLGNNSRFTATPLVVDDTLYLCDPLNRIIALDAATGKERWRHDPKVNADKAFSIVCRGVSHHAGPGAGPCASRIIEGTLDVRLVAVDAKTGKPCMDFGTAGSVDLLDGVQRRGNGYYYLTSPPTIVGDLAIIGGYVIDNQVLDPARSVVRAYDVNDGSLRWAWDAGAAPDGARKGTLYAAGNPNAWAVFSADPALGLVYVPTGNASPDFFGGLRSDAAERFGTAIVALDVATGDVRWKFQAVRHDLWDYDMPAQPTLLDLPTEGGPVPALIAATKTGQIFALDRRTGVPLIEVEERPVPASDIPGERAAPTQPYASGLPSFSGPPIKEKDLWGATPIDMMLCRLQFRRLRYDGDFTPPSTEPFLFSPGTFGAINWGGVSYDRDRGLLVVNSSNMPFVGRLVPRAEADEAGARPFVPKPGRSAHPSGGGKPAPMAMAGTPYGLTLTPFLSPVFFPCTAPPWGTISAIDLKTRTLAWQRPFGTTRGLDPLSLSLPVGTFNLGGSVATAGGVTFIGAATDSYLRAFETGTGRELWRANLPAGGQANPITYAVRDGRQMVAIVAGGHGSLRTPRGDYVVAYALPRTMSEGN